MKVKDIKNTTQLKEYLKQNYSTESWYANITDDDLNAVLEYINSDEYNAKASLEDKILEIQTIRHLETMSNEELSELVEGTKDKTTKADETETNEFDPDNLLDLSEDDAKKQMDVLSTDDLESLINKFETDDTVTDGVRYLKMGYVEYAREVICGRAIANLYDGLKPVQRRILYTLNKRKNNTFIKSMKLIGETLTLHPHGDAPVYQASVLMTDINGSQAFPTLKGQGNFGDVNTTDPAAAPRYTEVKLHDNAEEYFREMKGVNIIPNFDDTTEEAEVLPISFPSVLVNSSSGIAVGWSSNIPSFNFNDVCDLVIEYLKKGKCSTVICPDFVTGGYYVKNNKELQKLMLTGVATLKLRAKTHIEKKSIRVEEIPAGQTVQRLVQKINDLDYQYIKNAYDTVDLHHNILFTVDCSASTQTDNVLHYLLRKTPLQCNFNANISVIKDGKPVTLGVWQVIEDWVAWRKDVLYKDYDFHIKRLKEIVRTDGAFLTLLADTTRCYELINTIITQGKDAGIQYITDHFTRDEIPEDLIEFVATRSLPSYHNGGSYASEYEKAKAELDEYIYKSEHLDETIINQMKDLKKTYGKKRKRKTEITTQDFTFTTKEEKSKAVDKSSCYYDIRNGFIKKIKTPTVRDENVICAKANSILVLADSMGRLIKVYGEDLSYSNSSSDIGIYIPNYAKVNDEPNYEAKLIGLVDGSKYFILYKDGYCSFIDTKPWLDSSRKTKVISKGIAKGTLSSIGYISNTKPDRILLIDSHNYMIDIDLKDVKEKGSASRTKLCSLARKTPFNKYLIPTDENCIINRGRYNGGRPKMLNIEDLVTISFTDFIEI